MQVFNDKRLVVSLVLGGTRFALELNLMLPNSGIHFVPASSEAFQGNTMTGSLLGKSASVLAHYTSPGLMVPELQGLTAADTICELGEKLNAAGRLMDCGAFIKAAMAREQLSPTSCAPGWALPHARLKDLAQLSFALGRCSRPLAWIGDCTTRVKAVWLFAVPESETKAYLNLIASVARLSQNGFVLDQLMQAPDAATMCEIFEQVPLRGTSSGFATSAA